MASELWKMRRSLPLLPSSPTLLPLPAAPACWLQGANPETEEDADFWGYQYCTEQFMPFSKDGGE